MNCVFCKSEDYTDSYYPNFTFNKKAFRYITCKSCELVYLDRHLEKDDLDALYSLDYHEEFYFNPDKSYERQAQLLQRFNLKGSMLDYGCGDGGFLRYFKSKGFTVSGAEYNPRLVELLRQKNSDVHFQTIDGLMRDSTSKFDIIHLGDVLEHLQNPIEIIQALKTKLTVNGVLFIEGPIEHNFSLAYLTRAVYFKVRKWLQPKRVTSIIPYHIFFATKQNQLSFFEQQGLQTRCFDVYEWEWPYPDRWRDAKSINRKLQFVIGKTSKSISRLHTSWGNRFMYLGGL